MVETVRQEQDEENIVRLWADEFRERGVSAETWYIYVLCTEYVNERLGEARERRRQEAVSREQFAIAS